MDGLSLFFLALPQEKLQRIKMLKPRGGHSWYFSLYSVVLQEKFQRIKMLKLRAGLMVLLSISLLGGASGEASVNQDAETA
uniref:Uncharacterized protein n=1 Tax=Ditylenchus dipsaci TaxID=166011 RepID=A0A915EUT8_9BILA